MSPHPRRGALIAAALAAAALATGCSVADPDSSQLALHYTGGPFSSQNFTHCIDAGQRDVDGPGDVNFYYPAGQRTWTFSDHEGADAPPIQVATSNQVEVIARGTITLTLNPSCEPYTDATGRHWPGGRLQKFHDTIGRHLGAYAESGGDAAPPGWDTALTTYVGGPAKRAMDNAGLGFTWQQLYADPNAKNAWTKAVEERLPKLIAEQAGDDLFLINNIQLDKPDIPDGLSAEVENNSAAELRRQTSETDQRAAAAFPGGLPAYQQYKQQEAINKAITEGRVNPLIVPQGSPVIAGQGAGAR